MSILDKVENIFFYVECGLIFGGTLVAILGEKFKKPVLENAGMLSVVIGSSSLILSFPTAHANAYYPNNRQYTFPYGITGMAIASGIIISKHLQNNSP